MSIRFTKECQAMLRRLELFPDSISEACESPDQLMLTQSSPPQVYLVKWMGNGKIMFVHGVGHKIQKKDEQIQFIDMEVHSALELREELPTGWIHSETPMRAIFDHVVQSFGIPVSCHKEEPLKRLYVGRWDGRMVRANLKKNDYYQVSGDFNIKEGYAQDVWVFSYKRYKDWFLES